MNADSANRKIWYVDLANNAVKNTEFRLRFIIAFCPHQLDSDEVLDAADWFAELVEWPLDWDNLPSEALLLCLADEAVQHYLDALREDKDLGLSPQLVRETAA